MENYNTNEILNTIENNEFYQNFLNSDSKTKLSQSLSITEQVKKLGEGIELLNSELQKQVQDNYDDLLRQGNHATKLENVLNTINGHVQNLFVNADRLRNQIHGPYNALETHTKVLGRLHLASHILRQINRIQQLSKRLQNTNDPIQKAIILHELEQLTSNEDLKEIDAVTNELRNIRAQQQKVVNLARGSLNQGIINENTVQATTALQIFINLGTIETILKGFIEEAINECKECLKGAFDASINASRNEKGRGPGRANLVSSQGFRSKIWSELEKVFNDEIFQQCRQVKFLQNSLNTFTIDNINTEIASKFWTDLGNLIQNEIKNSSPAIQQTFEEDYPKLLKLYYEMYEKLKCKKFFFNRSVLEKCENAYLSNSLAKLMEPAQAMFNDETDVPTHDQIDGLIRIITNELSMALIEEILSGKICRNVSKCIKMFAVKTEQQLETGSESDQVIGGVANSGQQKNVHLANALYYLQVQFQRLLSNMKESLPENGVKIINDGLECLHILIGAIMQPLINSINNSIETIIVTIHQESDWGKLQTSTTKIGIPCSPFMKELTQFISRTYHTYLENFDNKEVLHLKCSEIVVRCIEILVRHCSLLRPLSQGGRIRLHSDFLHLEHTLKVIYPQLSDLGRPYRLLKSIASIITLSPAEIVASQAAESSIPYSTILLLLFSFANSELASPHQNTGWSISKLSAWLDEHPSEIDRLDLIAGALQRYENLVRQNNSPNWDPVYPFMSQLLEIALNENTK